MIKIKLISIKYSTKDLMILEYLLNCIIICKNKIFSNTWRNISWKSVMREHCDRSHLFKYKLYSFTVCKTKKIKYMQIKLNCIQKIDNYYNII